MEGARQIFLDAHHGSAVVELSTVVRRREDCDELLLGEELIAVLNDLMSATDEIQLVFPQKRKDDLLTEDIADSSFGLAPHFDRGFGVGPQKVAQQSGVGNVGGPSNGVNLINSDQFRRQSSVHA